MVCCVVLCCGVVRYGTVRYGMVWYGTVRYGMVWYGMVWYGMVWYGMVWYGMVWYGMVWYGMVQWGRKSFNFGVPISINCPTYKHFPRKCWRQGGGQCLISINFKMWNRIVCLGASPSPHFYCLGALALPTVPSAMVWYDMIWYKIRKSKTRKVRKRYDNYKLKNWETYIKLK